MCSISETGQPSPYEYTALDIDEIRVLHIKPARNLADPLECTIAKLKGGWNSRDTFIENKYLTWSYAWGETFSNGQHLTHGIVCDGQPLKVTRHLWDGLKRFRAFYAKPNTSNKYRYDGLGLWVDAICINQKDSEEKSRQVQIMGEIYRRSAALVVWLGEVQGRRTNVSLRNFCAIESDSILRLAASTITYVVSRHKGALKHIVESPWFARRWVVQEVLMTSRDFKDSDAIANVALIGEHALGLDRLSTSLMINEDLRKLDTVGLSGWDRTGDTFLWRIITHENANCSSHHDLVYALLHTCSDRDRLKIKVDYSQDVAELFLDVADSIMREPLSVREPDRLLALASCRPAVLGGRCKVPSWVPDWRSPATYECKEHEQMVNGLGEGWTQGKEVLRSDVVGPHLRLKGWIWNWRFHPDSAYCVCKFCQFWKGKGKVSFRGKKASREFIELMEEASRLDCLLFSRFKDYLGPYFILTKTSKVVARWGLLVHELVFGFERPDLEDPAFISGKFPSGWVETIHPLQETYICIG